MESKTTVKATSGSNINANIKMIQLQQDIDTIKKQVDEINSVLKHVITSNFEISNDMQVIYESLNSIAETMSTVESESSSLLFNPFDIGKDDDLPN